LYQPLPTPEEMARWDRLSIEEYAIREELLMENAARESLHALSELAGPLEGKSVVLFAGPGNNGGDAFALARHLGNEGARVLVLHAKPQKAYKGATAYHLFLAKAHGVPLVFLPRYNLDFLPAHDIVVDGLLGTGFAGALRQEYLDWVRAINRMGERAFILSLDVPSGLDAGTGEPLPEAVTADATVTFEEAKLGLVMGSALDFTGRLIVRRIGIPRQIKKEHPPSHVGMNRDVLAHFPVPERDLHKGTAGHVLVVGGSRGLTGAPALAGLGALRSGAGMVTIACPGKLGPEIKAGQPDLMTMPLGENDFWTDDCFTELEHRLDRFDAVVIGPGMGRRDETLGFVRRVFETSASMPPMLVDADGLYWLTKDESLLATLHPGTVLTPHPGEMGRLMRLSTGQIQADRAGMARELSKRTGGVVVLKGAGTIVASRGNPTAICPIQAPTLAVGGSGDVLSGCIGSLLARGVEPFDAACLGAYWHAYCGLYLEQTFPFRGNLAQEIAHGLPEALEELFNAHCQGHHDQGTDHLHPGDGGHPGCSHSR
jgi:ADP-dependent NAD(P)H-hydrate dehydratase / NAD(P)H-hydrate epimerase